MAKFSRKIKFFYSIFSAKPAIYGIFANKKKNLFSRFFFKTGDGGNRTHVQNGFKQISTGVVSYLSQLWLGKY